MAQYNLKNNLMESFIKSKDYIFHGVLIGLAVGCLIAFTDFLLTDLALKNIQNIDPMIWPLFPILGSFFIYVFNKLGKIKNTSMADEIVKAYHRNLEESKIQYFFFKYLSFLTTIIFGFTAGFEGASKWIGGVFGLYYFKFIDRLKISGVSPSKNISLMAGASAGIAAIFRAPLSGTIMALESPFKKDFDHDSLIQSFLASVVSFSVFSFIRGHSKFFIFNFNYTLKVFDLFVAIILGILCGLISLFINISIQKLKIHQWKNSFFRHLTGGLLLSIVSIIFYLIFQKQDVLYSGTKIVNLILNSSPLPQYIFILMLFRIVAFIITFSYGAVGGQFLPSAAIGACLGYLIQILFNIPGQNIFALIGLTAFISASYNGLLLGPVLIAELTGRPELVVLSILASSISYLFTNGISNSSFQIIQKSN